MQQVKAALQSTSTHGLPRVVSNKPIYVRLAWLVIYLTMMGLFLKGFADFVVKLQSGLVTTSFEANHVTFKFPDVYICAENPISATYSERVGQANRDAIHQSLADIRNKVVRYVTSFIGSAVDAENYADYFSSLYPQSLPYALLVNALAHRAEQMVTQSVAIYRAETGFPKGDFIIPTNFYDSAYLRCFKWNISTDTQSKILQSGYSAGLVLTLMTDATPLKAVNVANSSIESRILLSNMLVPVHDWSLTSLGMSSLDRRAGVRVYLTPPGEYPTDFVTSFSLNTGRYHTVEIEMTRQSYQSGHFDCLDDPPDVQFLNPYDQTPYNMSYSYSYCYYLEYHSQFQSLLNTSGQLSPLPWPLKGMEYLLNFSSLNLDLILKDGSSTTSKMSGVEQTAINRCKPKRQCKTLDYTARVSSVNWPTDSSVEAFINSTVKAAWVRAQAQNQSVPVLDFLMTANRSTAASYLSKNLLKVHFKPASALCSGVVFSRDYGLSNFVSDIGGIMGIYLGMSLMTFCEIFELIFDLLFYSKRKNATAPSLPKSEIEVNSTVAVP